MKMRTVLLVAALAVATAFGEDPKVGETWYVSTASISLRKEPNGLSPAVATLKYKTAAKISGIVRVAVPFNGDKDKFPDTLMPNWAKVEAGGETGYLPVSALASEWLIANQDPNSVMSDDGTLAAKRGFSESENGDLAAMRGFSEAENGDLAAMRGAAGKGRAAAKADPSTVAKMMSARPSVSDAEVQAFVQEGSLAKDDVRKQDEIKAESGGFFGGFMTTTRKATSSGLGFASALADKVAGDDKTIGAAANAGKLASGLVYSELGPVQEYQVGLSVAARILPLYPPVAPDDPAAKYVSRLGATLAAASNDPMPYNGYSFVLVKSDEVNAFAVPGGFVFVTTGMLKFLKNEDELAAILGHEMGHMELRHGMKAVGKENVLKIFSLAKEVGETAAGDQASSEAVAQLKALADSVFEKMTTSIRNGYGIEFESQADWRAVQFLKALGYDTASLYNVLERFKSVKGSYGGASYPAERGADVLRYMKEFGCGGEGADGAEARAARYRAVAGK